MRHRKKTVERAVIVLTALKAKPMITSVLRELVCIDSSIDKHDMYYLMLRLETLGCVKRKMLNRTKVEWKYIKDYPEEVEKTKKVKEILKPVVIEPPPIPASEWMNWQYKQNKKVVVEVEPKAATYSRSADDIKAGIYRAENRKGNWNPDKPTRARNVILGNSFNSGAW